MKNRTLIIAATAFALTGATHAEEGKPDRPHRKLPPEIVEKFDKDGDGKLDKEEREAAKAAHKAKMLEKFDTDGDGELSDSEREAMRAERKKRMLEKFDKDGDGELSDAEKAEARKALGDRRPHGKKRKHGPRKGPKGGDEEAPGAGE